MHGHDFRVTVRVEAEKLDALETVMDFHVLEKALAGVLEPWRGRKLNEIEPFRTRVNPSAERIAEQIGLALKGLGVVEVRITEARNCLAIWSSR